MMIFTGSAIASGMKHGKMLMVTKLKSNVISKIKGIKIPIFILRIFILRHFTHLITKPESEYKNFEFRLSDLYSDSNNGLLIS